MHRSSSCSSYFGWSGSSKAGPITVDSLRLRKQNSTTNDEEWKMTPSQGIGSNTCKVEGFRDGMSFGYEAELDFKGAVNYCDTAGSGGQCQYSNNRDDQIKPITVFAKNSKPPSSMRVTPPTISWEHTWDTHPIAPSAVPIAKEVTTTQIQLSKRLSFSVKKRKRAANSPFKSIFQLGNNSSAQDDQTCYQDACDSDSDGDIVYEVGASRLRTLDDPPIEEMDAADLVNESLMF